MSNEKTRPAKRLFWLLAAAFLAHCEAEKAANFETTDIGEQKTIPLDGLGQARLNACTAIVWDAKAATAALDGEAFFECADGQILKAKTPDGLLILRSAKAVAKARPELFEVQIFDGQAVFESPSGQPIRLAEGEGLRRDSTEKGPKKRLFQSKKPSPDWLSGFSSYENERLRNVFFDLERQFDIRVRLAPEAAALPFSGLFRHENLEAALAEICRPAGLVFEKTGQKVVVKKAFSTPKTIKKAAPSQAEK